MKKFRKIMAVLVAAVLMVAMITPMIRTNVWAQTYTITIKNSVKGEDYYAYRIFDATEATPFLTDNTADNTAGKYYIPIAGAEASKEANRFVEYYRRTGSAGSYTYTKVTDNTAITNNETVYELINKPVAYTLNTAASNKWLSTITTFANETSNGLRLTPIAGIANTSLVEFTADFKASEFAKELKAYHDDLSSSDMAELESEANATGTGNGSNLTLNVDEDVPGYYFVDTSLGALAALDTTVPGVDMYEKNEIPTNDKKVWNTTSAAADKWDTTDDAQIGDTVRFRVIIEDVIGTDEPITLYDVADAGITLDKNSILVLTKVADGDKDANNVSNYYKVVDGKPILQTGDYNADNEYYIAAPAGRSTINKTENTVKNSSNQDVVTDFNVVLDKTYVTALKDGDQVYVFYEGVVNDAAVFAGDANVNGAFLKYSKQTTQTQFVQVYTLKFGLAKTDQKDALLSGAEFSLYRANTFTPVSGTGTNPINFWKKSDGKAYRVVETNSTDPYTSGSSKTTTITSLDSATLSLEGLDVDTYYLVETKAPAGYNALPRPIKIVVTRDSNKGSGQDASLVNYAVGSGDAGSYAYTTNAYENPVTGTITTEGSSPIKWKSGGVEVENIPGTELPSTGGMGTTVLYIVGGMLVILAGAYLFFSRKRTA